MCTVTFFKDKQRVIITSNRDEHIKRPLAIHPKEYYHHGAAFYYPVDPQSMGTWFCVKENGHTLVLLNGADQKHYPNPPYRKSRGVILLEISKYNDSRQAWEEIDLTNIEPFTIVVYNGISLTQFRWNGKTKSIHIIDETNPQIWSSVTLYNDENIAARESWFYQFILNKGKNTEPSDFITFHTKTEQENSEFGLIINRKDTMLTKNVTQCVIEANSFKIEHYDLITNVKSEIKKTLK